MIHFNRKAYVTAGAGKKISKKGCRTNREFCIAQLRETLVRCFDCWVFVEFLSVQLILLTNNVNHEGCEYDDPSPSSVWRRRQLEVGRGARRERGLVHLLGGVNLGPNDKFALLLKL
jgi:hypothetical protein